MGGSRDRDLPFLGPSRSLPAPASCPNLITAIHRLRPSSPVAPKMSPVNSPMKLRSLLAALVLGLSLLTGARAEDAAAPASSPASADLNALVRKIGEKLAAGSRTAEALAPELAEFDALLTKYPEKTDDTAQIAMMRASLYLQIFADESKGKELLLALQRDFPGTKPATTAGRMLEQMTPEAKAKAAAAEAERKAKLDALVGQPAPDLNFTWSNTGDLATLSALKGKVVVLDFWATWCGPCIATFPQIRELAAHYRDSPVAIIGVTSLQGRVYGLGAQPIDVKNDPAREMALMHDFIKAKDVTWNVAFSSQPVFNPDYAIRGTPYVAIIAPDGTVRHAGLHPSAPLAEKTAKIDAILKEFNLPVPATKS